VVCETSRSIGRRRATRPWSMGVLILGSGLVTMGLPARADPEPVMVNGLPETIVPAFAEVGLGAYMPPSTGTTVIGSPGSGGSGGGSGGGGGTGDSTALSTMDSESWGPVASSNAAALGVNPSALAATCVIESGCQNVAASGNSTVAGAFQMTAGTYNAALASALAENPALGTDITPGTAGQLDPATESIAAAEYLKQAATTLQNAGISNPTVLDTRGIYNFGPTGGTELATASDSAAMSDVLSQLSSTTLTNNGITPGETVGQWRASVSAKIGDAANQSAMTG
jgi:hypothetical protein